MVIKHICAADVATKDNYIWLVDHCRLKVKSLCFFYSMNCKGGNSLDNAGKPMH